MGTFKKRARSYLHRKAKEAPHKTKRVPHHKAKQVHHKARQAPHHEAKPVPHLPKLLRLPAEIKHTIFSYFLGSPAVRYTTFHGQRKPLEEGRCKNGKFISSHKFQTPMPLDQVSTTLRNDFRSYSWPLTHLVINNVYDLTYFTQDYYRFTNDIRVLTLTLATMTRAYGGYLGERTKYMALLHRIFVNLTELNLYCNFEGWRDDEAAGKDDFRLMPFFQSLKPFPQLKVFRLLDKKDSLRYWPDKSPNVLSTMNNWMRSILCGEESPNYASISTVHSS